MTAITSQTLVKIAGAGGGLSISAKGIVPNTLMQIAAAAGSNPVGSRPLIFMRDCQEIGSESMLKIASLSNGTVVVVL